MKDTFIKRLETAFIPKSLFHLRTNFPLQEPIFFFMYFVDQVIKLMRMKKW